MSELSSEEIISQLNKWQQCFDVADKMNDLENMNKYATYLSIIHTWFIKEGWVIA